MKKILVHLHLYYQEQLEYFLDKLNNIVGCNWDLYVTVVEYNNAIAKKILKIKSNAKIIQVPNEGYDISPFWQILQLVELQDYDYVLKIHTKRFFPNKTYITQGKEFLTYGFKWRNDLLDCLLKNRRIFKENIRILNKNKFGIIGPLKYLYLICNETSSEKDIQNVEKLKKDLLITSSYSSFFAGTMFLIRADILKRFKNFDLHLNKDTEKASSGISSLLSHAIERIFAILTVDCGYEVYAREQCDFTQKIFSIKKSLNKKHTVFTFLGIKISIRDKLIHHLFSISNKKKSNGKWHKIIYILGIKISFRNKRKEKRFAVESEKQFIRHKLNCLMAQNDAIQNQVNDLKIQNEAFRQLNNHLENDFQLQIIRLKQDLQIVKLKNKIKNGSKIKVCFLCLWNIPKTFIQSLLDDSLFDVTLILMARFDFEKERQIEVINKLETELNDLYCRKFSYINTDNVTIFDINDKYDIIYYTSPYMGYYPPKYRIQEVSRYNVLTIFYSYAFTLSEYVDQYSKLACLNKFWKIFLVNETEEDAFSKQIEANKLKKIGWHRTDIFENTKVEDRKRKKIVIAPHSFSAVNNNGIEMATWPFYSDIILELPKLFPEIDFVFRPHPFLWDYLVRDKLWSQKQVDEYCDKIKSYNNCIYQNFEQDHIYDFVNSDAVIHDCVTFLAESLYNGHPACYLMNSSIEYQKIMKPLGLACIENHYKAYNSTDLINFIRNVVLSDEDVLRKKRVDFVDKNLKQDNYGHVGLAMKDYLKNEILEGD